jgi:hypothetical protein
MTATLLTAANHHAALLFVGLEFAEHVEDYPVEILDIALMSGLLLARHMKCT